MENENEMVVEYLNNPPIEVRKRKAEDVPINKPEKKPKILQQLQPCYRRCG